MVARSLLLAALALAGCAGPGVSRRLSLPPPAGESRVGARAERRADPAIASAAARPSRPEAGRAVEVASSLVGRRDIVVGGRDYGDDCAALVRAALDRAGRPVPAEVRDAATLYGLADGRGLVRGGIRAQPGDLIFLADRPGGAPAHVGLVAKVDPDGTALVLHRMARGVMRLRVNLGYPGRIADPATGKRLNDTLAVGAVALPAGSLVVAVASPP
jgi:hypothetical protein